MQHEIPVSSDDWFADIERQDKVPPRKGRSRRKKSMSDIFAELKVKMVMRIYGVSAARATEIIAGRAGEKRALEREKDKAGKKRKGREECGFIPAEDLFSL